MVRYGVEVRAKGQGVEFVKVKQVMSPYHHPQDFTYVDDIVRGLVKIMEWRDEDGMPQVFNLGNNQPEELMRFIKVMEETLKKTAEVKVGTRVGRCHARGWMSEPHDARVAHLLYRTTVPT